MCASEKSTLPPCIGCAAIWPRAGSFALASLPPRPRPFGAQRRHPASALCVPQPDHRQDKGHGRTSGQARQTPVRPSEGPRPGAGQEPRSTLAPFARGNLLLVRKELIMWTSLPDSRRTARIAGAKPRNREIAKSVPFAPTTRDRNHQSARSAQQKRTIRLSKQVRPTLLVLFPKNQRKVDITFLARPSRNRDRRRNVGFCDRPSPYCTRSVDLEIRMGKVKSSCPDSMDPTNRPIPSSVR